MDDFLDASMMGGMMGRIIGNELSPNNMHACPHLSPTLELRIK
jgi:hypothetical protein